MTPTQSQRKEETRRQILDAAAAAFAKDGYAATSLNDVIRRSELTKGAFYFHFPSKEALALAVVDDLRDQWSSAVTQAVDLEKPAAEQARDMASLVVKAYSGNSHFRALGRLVPELVATRPDLATELQATLFMWIDFIEAIIVRGQSDGAFRTDVSSRQIAEAIFGAFNGVEEFSELASGGADLEQRIDTLWALLENGMTAHKSSKRKA
jgi:AcrR family transcriptional regulator